MIVNIMADDRKEPDSKRKKTDPSAKLSPPDSYSKNAFHPSGSKFHNAKLWKHYKLARSSELKTFNNWALCALCEQNMKIIWISRADGSTTKMT